MRRRQPLSRCGLKVEYVDGLGGIGDDEIFRLGRTPKDFGVRPCCGKKLEKRATRANHLVTFNVNASSVGPDVPRGRRLGPDLWNSDRGFFRLGSVKKPMKQF